MTYNDNLPPGVSVGMIPGNRPEDARWEQVAEKWQDDPSGVLEVCKANRDACQVAAWAKCDLCGGDGYALDTLNDCNRCEGYGDTFDGCGLEVWEDDPDAVEGVTVHDASDCPYIMQKITDAVNEE